MGWFDRFRRPRPQEAEAPDEVQGPGQVEGAVPGAAGMFADASEGGEHSVLDLGTATERSFHVYSRYARRVRFADLLAGESGAVEMAALDALPPQPERPYDLLFAWNLLDWVSREDRLRAARRLIELSATNARLHLIMEAADEATIPPLRFTLLDVNRVRYEQSKRTSRTRPPLLPAEVSRLIEPFQVQRAMTLKSGLREYVAVRKPDERPPARDGKTWTEHLGRANEAT